MTYPENSGVLQRAGLCSVEECILKRKTTVAQFAMENKIFQNCYASVPIARNYNQNVWWKRIIDVDINNNTIEQ